MQFACHGYDGEGERLRFDLAGRWLRNASNNLQSAIPGERMRTATSKRRAVPRRRCWRRADDGIVAPEVLLIESLRGWTKFACDHLDRSEAEGCTSTEIRPTKAGRSHTNQLEEGVPMKTVTKVTRSADASWKGDVKGGHGLVSTQSGILKQSRFSLPCRLDDEDRSEVNPEELIAAAAASCFSMALSDTLTKREQIPTELVVRCSVGLQVEEGGPRLKKLSLLCEGLVPSISQEQFESAVASTQETCPVYLALDPGFDEVEVTGRLTK